MSRSLDDSTARSGRDHGEPGDRVPQTVRHHAAQGDRAVYHLRGRNYHLNSYQATVLKDVGSFRTITAESLREHVYHGDDARLRKDLRDLKDQGLVTIESHNKGGDRYISLTRTGKNVTENHLRTNPKQVIYSGIVKKRELRHDAAVYDVYQKEVEKKSQSGGSPKRVVLDFELKKNVNRQLAKIQHLSPAERERQRKEIADAHELKLVNGKIQIPDVRVEYESRDQDQCKIDLECVTGHYKARQIAAKAAAGFKLYNQDYRGRSAERVEDLVGEVISL
jgi:DNA-binding PadR family transcriptional regulator